MRYAVILEYHRPEDYPCDFEPTGWKKSGGLTTTYANTQGNTLPIIWRSYGKGEVKGHCELELLNEEWISLYPRYFNPLTKGEEKKKKDLECFKTNEKKCPLNPDWDKFFFRNHWKKNTRPPCKSDMNAR